MESKITDGCKKFKQKREINKVKGTLDDCIPLETTRRHIVAALNNTKAIKANAEIQ
jgi:hypothetical protein